MLRVENVSKTYSGREQSALKDISFSINQGEFVALLGQNGAGKSTLINIIAGNVKKDSGTMLIGGHDLDRHELRTKNIFGIVPQEINFDYIFSVVEVLRNQSGYFGIKDNEEYIDELLEHLSLKDKKYEPSRTLSGGMKRRLLIAKALVHRPKLLILDEPTAGVDIELRHSLYAFLRRLHAEGTTIIMTTHYLEEAEALCDRIIVINQGGIIVDESKDKLLGNLDAGKVLEFYFDTKVKSDDFTFLAEYSPYMKNENIMQIKAMKDEIGGVFRKMAEGNIDFSNVKFEQKKLEDVFLKLVQQ